MRYKEARKNLPHLRSLRCVSVAYLEIGLAAKFCFSLCPPLVAAGPYSWSSNFNPILSYKPCLAARVTSRCSRRCEPPLQVAQLALICSRAGTQSWLPGKVQVVCVWEQPIRCSAGITGPKIVIYKVSDGVWQIRWMGLENANWKIPFSCC